MENNETPGISSDTEVNANLQAFWDTDGGITVNNSSFEIKPWTEALFMPQEDLTTTDLVEILKLSEWQFGGTIADQLLSHPTLGRHFKDVTNGN